MIEITGAHPPEYRLQPGDVIMVKRRLFDKKTKRPFWWDHFGVVMRAGPSGCRYIILDEKDRRPVTLYFFGDSGDQHIWYLPEDEWPDGVHAFRVKFILEGRLDEVI